MAIAPERKNALVLAREFRSELQARTGITDFDADSKSEALVGVFVDQQLSARNESVGAFYANQISTGVGDQLDEIGRTLGLPRFLETFARANRRDQNLAFYVDSGTFGDLNGAADIVVPAGARIFSRENENELGRRITYVLNQPVTLRAGSSLAYLSAVAEASGSESNVGGSTLLNHNFTDYVAGSGVKVINFWSILNGRPRENDRNYRYRLARYYDSLSGSNDAKVQLTSLEVPGVLDVRIVSGYYGIGSAAVIVLGPENESNSSTIRAVQGRLNQIRGHGMRLVAVPATSVNFDIEMEVKPTRSLNTLEKRQFETEVRRTLKNYLRSQGLSGSVSLFDAAAEISAATQSSVRLKNTGRPEGIFNTVYLRKGLVNGSTTERDLLVTDYFKLDDDEFADLGTLVITYV